MLINYVNNLFYLRHHRRFTEFCRMSTLYIFNGRFGNDRFKGSYTTYKNSVVDYTIGSPAVLSKCVNFKVRDFDPLFSDIHCALQFSLKSYNTDTCTIFESYFQTNVDEPSIHNITTNWGIFGTLPRK